MLIKKISKIFKNYFVTGMIVIVPLLVTFLVIRALRDRACHRLCPHHFRRAACQQFPRKEIPRLLGKFSEKDTVGEDDLSGSQTADFRNCQR